MAAHAWPSCPVASRMTVKIERTSEAVELGGQDEGVVGEAAGGGGGEGGRGPAPAELDVGMVALGLGQQGQTGDEAEGVAEVAELELAPQPQGVLPDPGGVELGLVLGGLVLGDRRRARLAGLAVAAGQLLFPVHRGTPWGSPNPSGMGPSSLRILAGYKLGI